MRREVVDCFTFALNRPVNPGKIKLPEEPVKAIEQLGKPFTRLQCRICQYIVIDKDKLRRGCKKPHRLARVGDKSQLYSMVKVQTFFRTGGLQRYFKVV